MKKRSPAKKRSKPASANKPSENTPGKSCEPRLSAEPHKQSLPIVYWASSQSIPTLKVETPRMTFTQTDPVALRWRQYYSNRPEHVRMRHVKLPWSISDLMLEVERLREIQNSNIQMIQRRVDNLSLLETRLAVAVVSLQESKTSQKKSRQQKKKSQPKQRKCCGKHKSKEPWQGRC